MKSIFKIIKLPGFSLVEILVVLGLFSGISALALGALFNAQSVNARLQETQAILDNMNLSSQTITREIRFGSDFHCATSLSVGAQTVPTTRKNCKPGTTRGRVLIFKPADAVNELDRVAFYVSDGVLYKDIYPYQGSTTVLQMTSNDVNITSFTMYVDGANTSSGSNDEPIGEIDYKQPMITIFLSGVTRPAKSSTPPATFDIETVVSSREIDNK